jgi:DNA mismatch endonuclease, patch repair protein
MRANRRSNTQPEIRVRRLLHASGLRYRVDYAPDRTNLRRRADIVFTRRRIAVFIDGCFWHGCPEHFIAPKANAAYWSEKIAANVQRDRDTGGRLRDAGWTVLRFWEHDDPRFVAESIIRQVETG